MNWPLSLSLGVILVLATPARASAANDAGIDADVDADIDADDTSNGGTSPTPVACGGALCDTTNGSECALTRTGGLMDDGALPVWLGAVALAMAGRRARRQRLGMTIGVVAVAMAAPSVCAAQEATPAPATVDVVMRDEPAPRRVVALGWNPVPLLTLGTISADVVIAPIDHHALVLSPIVTRQTTSPFWIYDDSQAPTQLPQQSFASWGGEIGYRYYAGTGGARGVFLGSSFLLSAVKATAANGDVTHYDRYGLAVDAGFSALVADRFLLSLGGGLQYTATTKSIPAQQWPVDLYANGGLSPRILGTIGMAF
jgi:hypothetical protein